MQSKVDKRTVVKAEVGTSLIRCITPGLTQSSSLSLPNSWGYKCVQQLPQVSHHYHLITMGKGAKKVRCGRRGKLGWEEVVGGKKGILEPRHGEQAGFNSVPPNS